MLVIFSAVTVGTIQFIGNSLPSGELLPVTTVDVFSLMLAIIAGLTAFLFAVDRIIAYGLRSERALRVYRTILFVAAFMLLLRQLQLYFGPVEDLTSTIVSVHRILFAGVALVALGILVGLCIRAYRGVALFFLYMSPVSLLLLGLLPFQISSAEPLPGQHFLEVAPPAGAQARPPVFILIFDELSYDVLAKDGEIDAASFPNFAALAEDSVWFTNATTNHLETFFAVPTLIDAVMPLTNVFQVRLYLQADIIEDQYRRDCGVVYTCRGIGYVSESNSDLLIANLALRTFYEARPEILDRLLERPVGWLLDVSGPTYPVVDPLGFHIFSKKHFDVFLEDISASEAPGRIYLIHSFLPHSPFVFNRRGEAGESTYIEQVMFTDSLLGAFVDKLKQEALYDDAVIIVTADHGERPALGLGISAPAVFLDKAAHVPLLVHAPGVKAQISDVDYQHIDLGATLMDVLGIPPLERSSGVSAFDPVRPAREKELFVHYKDLMRWAIYVYSQEDDVWHLQALTEEP